MSGPDFKALLISHERRGSSTGEALEMRSASEKTAQKREERLLSSTIYELGLAIMQQRLKDR